MPEITPNVSFDTIAREWRCKWSADADKASLVKAQDELASVLAEVQRARCRPLVMERTLGACAARRKARFNVYANLL